MSSLARLIALSCVLVVGCGDGTTAPRDFLTRGGSAVGVLTTSATDTSLEGTRTLAVEIWYPAVSAAATSGVIDFEMDIDKRATLGGLVDLSPVECVARETSASRGVLGDGIAHPLVMYSHCHNCTRWSAHFVVERLASHGFVVVSPDHTGNTLFDFLAGENLTIDSALVAQREADIRFLVDQIVAGELLPSGVVIDANRIGMLGHSIGSTTAGAVAQNDTRIAAVLGMAAPMDLFSEISVSAITVPIGMLVATEDNSITEFGNSLIRTSFMVANLPAYRMELVDAGHWSVTNIAGLTEGFSPGCGDDVRQTDGQPFTYIPVATANDVTASYVTAFFAAHLEQDATARDLLRSDPWPDAAPIAIRE